MPGGRRDRVPIAGGGLAGALAAFALARHGPDLPLLIVEEAETLGDAVMNAMPLTRQRDFSAGALHDLSEAAEGVPGAVRSR
jgi:2-polyprenyl-6-methoxyphenol hydroxylase-like FAD-dependent oxidoreductase